MAWMALAASGTMIMAVALLAHVGILPEAHAARANEGTSRYIWDRSADSNHRSLLLCEPAPNDDRCKIPFVIDNSVIRTRLSKSDVFRETVNAINTINSVTPYMGVQSVPMSANLMKSKTLDRMTVGWYNFERHCTWLLCPGDHGKDNHLVTFEIILTSNYVITFGTAEKCDGDRPIIWDIEKTIKHELWHMLGTEHSGERDSIVNNNGYACGMGDVPNAHDKEVLRAKYPAGVR